MESKFNKSNFYFLNRRKKCKVATYNLGSVHMSTKYIQNITKGIKVIEGTRCPHYKSFKAENYKNAIESNHSYSRHAVLT